VGCGEAGAGWDVLVAVAVAVDGAGSPAAHAGSNSCCAGGVFRLASRSRRSASDSCGGAGAAMLGVVLVGGDGTEAAAGGADRSRSTFATRLGGSGRRSTWCTVTAAPPPRTAVDAATAATFCAVAISVAACALWVQPASASAARAGSSRKPGRPGSANAAAGTKAAAVAGALRYSRSAARHDRHVRMCGRSVVRSSAVASPSTSFESSGASRSHSLPASIPATRSRKALRPSVRQRLTFV
jgi:hypothetical protein